MDKRVKGIKAKNSAKTVKGEGRTKESLIFFVHSSFPTDCGNGPQNKYCILQNRLSS